VVLSATALHVAVNAHVNVNAHVRGCLALRQRHELDEALWRLGGVVHERL
jgi:hypothetical protein